MIRSSHRLPTLVAASLSALLLAACGTKEEAPAADTAAAMAAAPAAPTMESMAGDFTWVMKAEAGDSVLGKGTSHADADGTGWTVNDATPKDTTKYTGSMVGDSIIDVSAPYTDPNAPKGSGQVTWRFAGKPSADGKTMTGMLTVHPVAKPDSALMRARAEVTRK
jgi:hypothetical protein